MEINTTSDFEHALRKLPQEIQKIYTQQRVLFIVNWRDPRLHTKKVKSLEHVFSFRVTRRYRVFFYFRNFISAVFFDIDHRKDAYKK